MYGAKSHREELTFETTTEQAEGGYSRLFVRFGVKYHHFFVAQCLLIVVVPLSVDGLREIPIGGAPAGKLESESTVCPEHFRLGGL